MRLILTSVLFAATLFVHAQNQKLDSLKILLKTASEDTNKVNILNQLSKYSWRIGNLDTAIAYAERSIVLATRLDFGDGLGSAYSNIGIAHNYKGNNAEALEYHKRSLAVRIKINDLTGIAGSYNNIGMIYDAYGNTPEALKNYYEALRINEKSNKLDWIANNYSNIGNAYGRKNDHENSLKNHKEALRIREKLGDKTGITISCVSLGTLYLSMKNFSEAEAYYQKAMKLSEEIEDKHGLATTNNGMGNVYFSQNKFAKALEHFELSLKMHAEIGSTEVVTVYMNIATLHWNQGRNGEAKQFFLKAIETAQQTGELDLMGRSFMWLAQIDSTLGDYKNAYEHHKRYMELNDSLNNVENAKKVVQYQMQYDFDKKESKTKTEQLLKDSAAQAEKKRQQMFLLLMSCGFLIVAVSAVFIFRSLRLTRQQKSIIETQKELVEEKHKEITDSINYAERIQRSFLATKDLLDSNLKDYFILFQPKDVVSGDFYWASTLPDGRFALATADSTGHGVPGAIMSLLNTTSLEKAIEHHSEPSRILDVTRSIIIDRLKKDGSADGGKDGMDCSLCVFDFKNRKLSIAAAHNPVWIVRGNEVIEIRPDKMPVGKHDLQHIPFKQNEIDLRQGDVVYTLTDGYPDQFGGENGKKFMSKKLRLLLAQNAHLPMDGQKQILQDTFTDWKNNLEQVDDVTIVGVRI